MDDIKTLPYDWEFGHEEVALEVASYENNGSLYIGLCNKTEDGFLPFDDLTVNLWDNNFRERSNEAYIDHNFSQDKLRFIKQNKLGVVLPEVGYSGYCKFVRVAFDLERLKEFDMVGVQRYMSQGQIKITEAKKQKNKKRDHEER